MRLQKVFRLMLFGAFFLWLHFWLRSWIVGMDGIGTICNSGGPFGIPLSEWLLVPIGFGVGTFLLVQWWKEASLAREWPWILIVSGGAGNLLERGLFGCIMDYIALPFFPVFNIADILLTIGVLGIFFNWYWDARRNHEL